jgi:excisionase family DNA binding protein
MPAYPVSDEPARKAPPRWSLLTPRPRIKAEALERQWELAALVRGLEPVAMTAPKPSIVPADALAISIPEAAGRLGIGETTLRAMIDGGILPAVRIGLPGKRGRVVVRVSDLDKLLAAPAGPKAPAGKTVTP